MIVTHTGPGRLEIDAPAKLNLFLEVTGKRPDGFHELETVMHAIDLRDTISIGIGGEGIRFTCSVDTLGPEESNLAVRAARLFCAELAASPDHATRALTGASINLKKRIHAGAGLGGGSSDAAAVLIGLNELTARPFGRDRLVAMGNRLGSDVAFFFFCGTALCTGRGEIVEPIAPVAPFRFSLIYPGIHTSTKDVYENLKLGLTKVKKDFTIFIDTLIRRHTETHNSIFNRLQDAAFRVSPALRGIRDALFQSGYGRYSLTGSGSGLFRILKEKEVLPDFRTIDQGDEVWKIHDVRSSPAFSQFDDGDITGR